jgi:hypothetical protein
MIVTREILDKKYLDLDLTKISNVLRVDEYSAIELKEIYEDSIKVIEDFIHKQVSLTTMCYTFCAPINVLFGGYASYVFPFWLAVIDEGNFIRISGVTYTDQNNAVITLTSNDYVLKYDSNQATIYFNNPFNAKELKVVFFCGYEKEIERNIRRALYILMNDFYDSERSSYLVRGSKDSDVVDRLLTPNRKVFFYDYKHQSNCNII